MIYFVVRKLLVIRVFFGFYTIAITHRTGLSVDCQTSKSEQYRKILKEAYISRIFKVFVLSYATAPKGPLSRWRKIELEWERVRFPPKASLEYYFKLLN